MKTIKIGTLDKPVSRIGLGTWAIGGGSAWGGDKDLQQSIETIQKAPGLGVNLIDTAPGYNFGNSERIIGQALKGMDREKVVIITKFGVVWDREGSLFNKVNGRQLYWNLSHESILDELKAQGKIRAIGAANVSPSQVEEYVKYGSLDIVQAKYSVLDRAVEDELLPVCKSHGISLQAYSPLEMGLLSGTFPRDYKPVGAQIPKKWFQPENLPKVFDFLDRIKPLAEKYRCTVADINMAWILAQDEKVILLSGSTTADQIRENVRSAEIELSPGDVRLIRDMAEELG